MNHIYKVILGTFVAATEFAAAHGKSSGTRGSLAKAVNRVPAAVRKFLPLNAIAFGLLLASGQAQAQMMTNYVGNDACVVHNGSTLTPSDVSIVCGDSTTKLTSTNGIAIGTGVLGTGVDVTVIGWKARATSEHGLALGSNAWATGREQAIAIGGSGGNGPGTYAEGDQSIAIGGNTHSKGNSSVAIGGDDLDRVASTTPPRYNATGDTAALNNTPSAQTYSTLTGDYLVDFSGTGPNPRYSGTQAGEGAVALGVQSKAGNLATAFGTRAKATGVTSVAIGVGSTADKDGAIAVGAGSNTKTDATKETEASINGINYGGFVTRNTMTPGDQVSVGSKGYERQIKNVAAGSVAADSADAINGSQLYATNVVVGNLAKTTAANLGGGVTVGTDGKLSQPSYNVLSGNTASNTAGSGTAQFGPTAKTVADGLTNLNTYINQGFNVKDNAGATQGVVTPGESVQFANGVGTKSNVVTEANGVTVVKYDVNTDGTTIKVDPASGNLTAVTSNITSAPNGTSTATTPTSLVTAGDVANAINNSGWQLQANGDTASLVKPGNTVQFLDGQNIKITRDGNNITVATADDVTFNSVTTGDLTVKPGSTVDMGGNKITNVAAGTDPTDAVNVSQLKDATAAATTKVTGDQGVTVTPTTNADGSTTYNVAAKTDNTTIKVDPATGNLTAVTSGITSAPNGTSTADNPTSLVTAGDVANAINNSGWQLQANGDTASLVKPGNTVQFLDGQNIKITRSGNDVTVATADDVTFNSVTTGDLTVKPGSTVDMGGNKITNVAAGTDPTDAVNVSQLKDATAAATTKVTGDQGVTVTPTTNADGSTTYNVAAKTDNTTIKVDPATGNLTAVTSGITSAPNGTSTADNPTSLVTAGDVATAINNSGWTLTANGANGGLVKPGAAVDMNNTDGNIAITKSGNNVTYNLAKDINVDSVTANNSVSIANGGPSMSTTGIDAANKTITNVAPGVADTDAVNVSQLKAVGNTVNNLAAQIGDVDRNARAGIAGGLAAAGLPQTYLPGSTMLAAATGAYRGEAALALGVSSVSDNGRWLVKGSVNRDSAGYMGVNAGIGYLWR